MIPNISGKYSSFCACFHTAVLGVLLVESNAQVLPSTMDTPPNLRTNAQDVQLAVTEQDSNSSPEAEQSPETQWKSLANPVMPEDESRPPTSTTGSDAISPSAILGGQETVTRQKKDDYGAQTGWGLRASGGVAIQQTISASLQYGQGHQYINFQPGARFDVEAFYNITNGFYFGLESAFIYNEINSVQRNDAGNPQSQSFISGDSDLGYAAFYQVPVLLNIRFQIPNSGRFRGYCTGGFGGVWDYYTYSAAQNTTSQHQWNYAFQLGAGLQYNLLPGLDLDTSFKTFITPNPLLFSDGTSQVKTSYSYAIEIGLAYRF